MPETARERPSPTDETVPPSPGMIELDPESIAMVAGGLNPQPLPPGRAFRFD